MSVCLLGSVYEPTSAWVTIRINLNEFFSMIFQWFANRWKISSLNIGCFGTYESLSDRKLESLRMSARKVSKLFRSINFQKQTLQESAQFGSILDILRRRLFPDILRFRTMTLTDSTTFGSRRTLVEVNDHVIAVYFKLRIFCPWKYVKVLFSKSIWNRWNLLESAESVF